MKIFEPVTVVFAVLIAILAVFLFLGVDRLNTSYETCTTLMQCPVRMQSV